jgi:hypothetical protein
MGNIIAELLQGPPLRERSCRMCAEIHGQHTPATAAVEDRKGRLMALCAECPTDCEELWREAKNQATRAV